MNTVLKTPCRRHLAIVAKFTVLLTSLLLSASSAGACFAPSLPSFYVKTDIQGVNIIRVVVSLSK